MWTSCATPASSIIAIGSHTIAASADSDQT